jgi:glycosyltransferase involved in cell wall biosynthesis
VKKILHVVPAIPFGGLQRLAALLASEQRRHGLNAQVLALYSGKHFENLLIEQAVPHTVIPGTTPNANSFQFYRTVLSQDWALVHLHGGLLWSNIATRCSKRRPVVYHAHNYPPSERSLKNRLLQRVNRSLVDLVIAVSESVAEAWRLTGVGSGVEVVYNSVEVPIAQRSRATINPNRPIVFGIATRLAGDKGIFEFVEVAAILKTLIPNARFVIAGEGPKRDELENEIRCRGLEEVFLLPGYVNNLDAFWSGIDVALFTAPKEPFGLRILEAMVRRVPVVGYLTGGGSDEILRSVATEITAPNGDAQGLARAALRLCNDPVLAADVSDRAYQLVVKRFNAVAMHGDVMRAYRRVIEL